MSETGPRRKRRWVLVGIGALAVLLLGVSVIVPRLVDSEALRPQIERILADATGWEAELGDIDLSLLRGALGVRPVSLRAPGGETSTIEVERIDVKVSLMALLRKELRVESIHLVRPEMVLVRPDERTGWVRPSIGRSGDGAAESTAPTGGDDERPPAADRQTTRAADGGFTVMIEEIAVRDGSLRFEDRALRPGLSLEVNGLTSSFSPADGGISGELSFVDGGRAAWNGALGQTLEVRLDDVATEILQGFVGDGLVHAGGRLSGTVVVEFPLKVTGDLDAEGLTLLSGRRPFPDASLDFAISPAGLGWQLDSLEFVAGDARLTGSGTLSPELALALVLPRTSLETALAASESVLPVPLDVRPPGHVEATIRVDQPEGQPLTYEARGSLAAAELRPGDVLPPVQDVRADFALDPSGRLDVQVAGGTIAGGAVSGGAAIDSIDPPGTLTFSGGLQDAVFGQLLGGLLSEAQPVLGPTGFSAALGLDLTREALDARSLSGRLDFGARELSMPGWDLDAALRGKLEEKAGSGAAGLLKGLLDRDDGKNEMSAQGVAEKVERLIDSLQGTIVFDSWPWGLQDVRLDVGDVASTGEGSFDPETGAVDFTLTSRLSAAESSKLLAKHGVLKVLADADGRLTVPVRVEGSLVAPAIRVEIEQALGNGLIDRDEKDDVKSLLKGLLDRKKD